MKIECIHGYFRFTETAPGQLSQFASLFGFDLERAGDHFTFTDLAEAPSYSIAGGLYLLAPALSTFAGKPWEIMRENRLVYDFTKGLVLPLDSIVRVATIAEAGYYLVSNGMLVPGSFTDEGQRVTDYAAFYDRSTSTFKYSEVSYA